jgi:hypothetical protein
LAKAGAKRAKRAKLPFCSFAPAKPF